MESYTYQPIKQSIYGIATRLVHLLPSRGQDVIEVQIEEVVLPNDPSEPMPKFDALSYEWDLTDRGGMKIHVLDPTTGNLIGRLPIRKNLAAALLRLRNAHTRRTLWIDAICINRNNCVEKAIQVMSMGLIYERAYDVVEWLGE